MLDATFDACLMERPMECSMECSIVGLVELGISNRHLARTGAATWHERGPPPGTNGLLVSPPPADYILVFVNPTISVAGAESRDGSL